MVCLIWKFHCHGALKCYVQVQVYVYIMCWSMYHKCMIMCIHVQVSIPKYINCIHGNQYLNVNKYTGAEKGTILEGKKKFDYIIILLFIINCQ